MHTIEVNKLQARDPIYSRQLSLCCMFLHVTLHTPHSIYRCPIKTSSWIRHAHARATLICTEKWSYPWNNFSQRVEGEPNIFSNPYCHSLRLQTSECWPIWLMLFQHFHVERWVNNESVDLPWYWPWSLEWDCHPIYSL